MQCFKQSQDVDFGGGENGGVNNSHRPITPIHGPMVNFSGSPKIIPMFINKNARKFTYLFFIQKLNVVL